MPVGDNPLQKQETYITDATPGPSSGEIKGFGKDLVDKFLGKAQHQKINRFDLPDQERQLEIRDQQGAYAALLKQQAQGQGPSLFAPALAAAQRAGTAVAASGRGANMALAGRTGAQTAARLGMGATELRAKEQLAAQQQYAALLQAQRQADLQARGMGVQLGVAQLGSNTQTAQGNAQRGQIGIGSVLALAGGVSDPAAKTNAAPVGSYQQPYGQQPYGQQQPGLSAGLTNMGNVLGGGQPPSGVDMKQNIEPIGGVNPRFSAPDASGSTGFGAAQLLDNGQQRLIPAAEADAQRRLNVWFAEQQAALAAQNHSRPVSGTQIDLELAQARDGASAGQYPGLQQQQQQQGGSLSQGLMNMGNVLGGIGSDPDMKTGQQPVGQLSAAAAQVQPYKFQYRPEVAAREGLTTEDRIGAMASKAPGSLAANPVYAPTVRQGPDGMDRVDGGQATMANIAVTADVARKQQLDSQRLDALEAMALQGASGKGARGRQVTAESVRAPAPQDANQPPPGAVPSGQRYKALADLGMTQNASYGADLGKEAPGGMRRGLVPQVVRGPSITSRATEQRDSLGNAIDPKDRSDRVLPTVRRQGELQALGEAGQKPTKFFGGKGDKALSLDDQAAVDLELDTVLEQRIADAAHAISQGVNPEKNYAALREALETRINVKQRRQDRLERLHGFNPDPQPYIVPNDAAVNDELSRRNVKTKRKSRRKEVDL